LSDKVISPNLKYARISSVLIFSTWAYQFWPPIKSMLVFYKQSSYDYHGFVTVFIVAGLFWLYRGKIKLLDPAPSIVGLIAMMLVSIGWSIAAYNNWLFGQNIFLIAMLPCIILTIYGNNIAKELIFPMSSLLLLMPIGYLIVPQMLNFMLKIINKYLEFIDMSWYLSNAEDTSKIKNLFYGANHIILIAVLFSSFSYLKIEKLKDRLIFVMASIVTPVLFNIITVILIISMELTGLINIGNVAGKYISIFIWLLSFLLVIGFFKFKNIITKFKHNIFNLTENIKGEAGFWNPPTRWFPINLVALAALVVPNWFVRDFLDNPWIKDYNLKFALKAPQIAGWDGPASGLNSDNWQPEFFGNSAKILASYLYQQRYVDFYSAYYYKIFQTGDLINIKNKIYDSQEWNKKHKLTIRVPIFSKNDSLAISELLLEDQNDNLRLVWYWYYVGSTISHDQDLIYMLNSARVTASIRDDSGVIILSTALQSNTNLEETRSRLIYFVNSLEPHFDSIMHPKKYS
jgi:EpsI family protein